MPGCCAGNTRAKGPSGAGEPTGLSPALRTALNVAASAAAQEDGSGDEHSGDRDSAREEKEDAWAAMEETQPSGAAASQTQRQDAAEASGSEDGPGDE